jgi:hypothetical protein
MKIFCPEVCLSVWDVARRVNVEKRKVRTILREDFVHGSYFGTNHPRPSGNKKNGGNVAGDMIKELPEENNI